MVIPELDFYCEPFLIKLATKQIKLCIRQGEADEEAEEDKGCIGNAVSTMITTYIINGTCVSEKKKKEKTTIRGR